MFLAGVIFGLSIAGFYLIGEAIYEARRMKLRRALCEREDEAI